MEQYQVEPTHSLTQVSGNWVIRAAETYSFPLSLAPWSALNHVPPPCGGRPCLFSIFTHATNLSTKRTCPIPNPRQAAHLFLYMCVCEWELLSALYLLIVMICANAVKCHLTFVNFGLDGTDLSGLLTLIWFADAQVDADDDDDLSLSKEVLHCQHIPRTSPPYKHPPSPTHTKLKLIELPQQPTWTTAKWAIISFSSGVLIKPSLAGWVI